MKNSMGGHDFDGSEFDNKAISLHDLFSTQLSLSSSSDACMNRKEGETSPGPNKEVPSAILHWPSKNVKQDSTEEEVTKLRLEMNGFPFDLSDSKLYADSSDDSSRSEQSSIISSPCNSFTVHSDTRSEDLDRTDIWISSLDLDAEDSGFFTDKEQFLDILGSDFPSPSFNSLRSQQFCPFGSSQRTSQREEANDAGEPIFWPFERTSYNSPEFDKFLSVSLRRNTMGIRCAEVRKLNPVLQRLQKNKLSSTMKSIEPLRSSINLRSKGTKDSQNIISKVATVLSRLGRTTKASSSSRHQPPRNCDRKKPSHLKIGVPRKVGTPQLQAESVQETKTGDIRNLAGEKSTIEELIGLNEFDGHEGIGSDLPDYQFSLWLSPR